MASVYEEAVKHPDWCPIQSQDCWTKLPDTTWSPLQQVLMIFKDALQKGFAGEPDRLTLELL